MTAFWRSPATWVYSVCGLCKHTPQSKERRFKVDGWFKEDLPFPGISTRAKMKLNNYCDPNGRPALAAALNVGCPIHCSLGTKAVQQRIMVPLGALV
jgi:hypothetical protein